MISLDGRPRRTRRTVVGYGNHASKQLIEVIKMNISPIKNGSWIAEANDKYVVTGVDRAGKRFKSVYSRWVMASGINVWQGSKWLARGGKKYLIQRVYN